ncbi:MAG TPA: glycosyltransferase family 2 protein [Terriglobales bacterium]|nr:glycosyltransferase family 2 protein [Terriglobales bacterium]
MAGAILALAWFSRIVDAALGMHTVADISRPEWDRTPLNPASSPRLSIIVPACNEEADVAQALTQLLHLDYENYEVLAVNDRSTDRTGEIMDGIAATASARGILKVIHIDKLPTGWLGKPHAMWTAANQASGDWLLFTDADVLFKPDAVRRALAYAEAEPADHLVLFPQIIMKQPSERMMIAFFQALFVFGHRPWKVADPKAKDHIGVGAFNLIRRNVYEKIGTYKALRFEVVDDMKLGKVVKEAGYAQRNVFGADMISLHWAKGAMGVVNNLTKNFFAVLSFQPWRVWLCFFGLAFLNLMPFVGIFVSHGWARVPYAIALGSMFLIYAGMSRRSSIPPYYFALHPVSTVLFLYTLLRSMFVTVKQGGIVWRGTKYPLEELKKGLV